METRFRALRVLSTLCKILGWVGLVLSILAGLAMLALAILGGRFLSSYGYRYAPGLFLFPGLLGTGVLPGVIGFLASLLAGALSFLVFFASSEWIQLALSIEQNTRETAYYLRGEGLLPTPPDSGIPLNS
jgi:hypothetical protein